MELIALASTIRNLMKGDVHILFRRNQVQKIMQGSFAGTRWFVGPQPPQHDDTAVIGKDVLPLKLIFFRFISPMSWLFSISNVKVLNSPNSPIPSIRINPVKLFSL